jgi:phosphofructokinase-like protein
MKNGDISRIGILTGGGDAPGLNAVIRAAVKVAVQEYGLSVVGFLNGFSGLINNQSRELTESDVIGILPRGGTILGTTNRDNPFHFPVEKDGNVEYVDVSDKIHRNLKDLAIDAMVIIGGDGTLAIAKELHDSGIKLIGVPKTIDNDIYLTDQTFGFDTALTTATEALDKLHTTAESHHRVMVLEVMGRNAGWIALSAGIAGGADVILIPEIPYNIDAVAEKITQRTKQGKLFSIVVVAEGAAPIHGSVTVQRIVKDSFEPVRLGGISNKIAVEIEALTGKETRVTILGHLQRGGSPTPYDRILATRYGAAAVNFLMAGTLGHMVCLNGTEIKAIMLDKVVGGQRKIPLNHELINTARQLRITLGQGV